LIKQGAGKIKPLRDGGAVVTEKRVGKRCFKVIKWGDSPIENSRKGPEEEKHR